MRRRTYISGLSRGVHAQMPHYVATAFALAADAQAEPSPENFLHQRSAMRAHPWSTHPVAPQSSPKVPSTSWM